MPKLMTHLRKSINEFVDEYWGDEEIILFGGPDGHCYDEGFVGVGYQQHRGPVAVYDREKCIAALTREFAEDGLDDPHTDAEEWFSFNTEGSWIGDKTPIIIFRFEA